jgi:vancomycin aglycone glucosyltransferase
MRVLLSAFGSRGGVEPPAALAVRLRELGAEVRVCAPLEKALEDRLARAGVPLVPVGPPVHPLVPGTAPPSAKDMPRRVARMIAEQFDKVAAAADGCDALVVMALMSAAIAARSAAEKLGIRYVYASYQPIALPSPYHAPLPNPARPFPPEVTDNRALWDLDAQSVDAVFGSALNAHRASIGLPPVDNVRAHVVTDHPWLAADPVLVPWRESADLDVVQTGAWILPDERPLPADLEAFLGAGAPPVYVGFGSMPMRAPTDVARAAIEAIRAHGLRALVSRGWAGLAVIDGRNDCLAIGEVNHQALFARVAAVVHHGGAGTTTKAARAGVPQVVVPQMADQPYWAGRVAALGIGTAHDGPDPTAESLSAALTTALTAQTRQRAAAVAGAIRADGTTVAATLLLDPASWERPPSGANNAAESHTGRMPPTGASPQLDGRPC